jgi:hypothetical protein
MMFTGPMMNTSFAQLFASISILTLRSSNSDSVAFFLISPLTSDFCFQIPENGIRVIGLAKDELGYILPEEDFYYPLNPLRPGNHYEETNSVGKAIGPAVIAAVEELLREIAEETQKMQPSSFW